MAGAINEMERRLAESNPHAGPNVKTEDFKQQPPSVKPAGKPLRSRPEKPDGLMSGGRSASFRNPHGRRWPMRHSPSCYRPSDCSS